MPDISIQQVVFAVCVGVFTAAAAVWDFRWRRIPNLLTLPVFALGWAYQAGFNGWDGLADAGLGFAVGFGTLFALWLIGGGGGGDVKMMGALSVWLGFHMTLMVIIVSTVFVSLATVGSFAWNVAFGGLWRAKRRFAAANQDSPNDGNRVRDSAEDRQRRRIMAYAVPVAFATWLVMLWKLPRI